MIIKPKIGILKANFIVESVKNLNENLGNFNQKLLIMLGKPHEILKSIVDKFNVCKMYISQAEASEEQTKINKIKAILSKKTKVVELWNNTLIDLNNLPFNINKYFPKSPTEFRNLIEKKCKIPKPFIIKVFKPFPKEIEKFQNSLFSIKDIGYIQNYSFNKNLYIGGETFANKRLKEYIWDNNCLQNYYETRNNLLGID